ncbi:unnamed protein product [Cercopithifilaria johnstoni]|uniref:Uncharacterized protein n=1 Tax=Cercopithifilaria johnstoni TaxID=2874296 RepID=A0A8J2QAV6_9BILA|nr:unnamed protein product [Cercopithifilaria johnstoni]
MSSSITGSEKHSGGLGSNAVLPEFDTEYACSDHAMVRHVVQTAVRNYFSASCTNPAHMTICIDFTEGAPIPNNSAPIVRYQAPLVQINVERKFTDTSTAVTKDSELPAASTTEKVDRGKESSLLNAAKKLSVFTIKEEAEDLKPVKAVAEILKSKMPLQEVYNLKSVEKKVAGRKIFEYLPVTCKKFMSQQMFMEWRKKYEEDKRALYTDQQVTTKDSLSSPVTARSNTSISFHETGMITTDEKTSGWEKVVGILGFESIDNRTNMSSKAIQIRGNLPDTL